MPRFKYEMRGLEDVQKDLGRRGANRLRRYIDDDIEQGVRDMAETSSELAPVETGDLSRSILSSVERVNLMEYLYGSHLPYAQRQEYEHNGKIGGDPTPKRAFFRKSIAKHTPEIEWKIKQTIQYRL